MQSRNNFLEVVLRLPHAENRLTWTQLWHKWIWRHHKAMVPCVWRHWCVYSFIYPSESNDYDYKLNRRNKSSPTEIKSQSRQTTIPLNYWTGEGNTKESRLFRSLPGKKEGKTSNLGRHWLLHLVAHFGTNGVRLIHYCSVMKAESPYQGVPLHLLQNWFPTVMKQRTGRIIPNQILIATFPVPFVKLIDEIWS